MFHGFATIRSLSLIAAVIKVICRLSQLSSSTQSEQDIASANHRTEMSENT